MINYIIFAILNFTLNNNLILKFRNLKFNNLEYNYNFLNESFEDLDLSKKIILSKKYLENKKFYEKNNSNYHSFSWLLTVKKIGGSEIIKIVN